MVKRAMHANEWTKFGHSSQLDLGFLHAHHVSHAYARHSHDYYVISLIERGRQAFMHQGSNYLTAPGGVILINPDAVHTGEAVDGEGFEMRCFYPTTAHMEMAVFDLTDRHQGLPFFKDVRVDHAWAMRNVFSIHKALFDGKIMLEQESRFRWLLAQLVKRYADISYMEQKVGNEKKAVERACHYIDEHFATGVSLGDLAQHVSLSPYYLLRVFRAEVGMPPYAYLENIRVRHAQRLIECGRSLVDVAMAAGFSSQSHMTRQFKSIIGTTPGQYARRFNT